MNVTKYEVHKYVAGAYDSDGKPMGPGKNSFDDSTVFDKTEEAVECYYGFDLKKEWEVEYKTSDGRSNNTIVAEIVKCSYEHDDEDEHEDEFVGEIETIAERWYGLDEYEEEKK